MRDGVAGPKMVHGHEPWAVTVVPACDTARAASMIENAAVRIRRRGFGEVECPGTMRRVIPRETGTQIVRAAPRSADMGASWSPALRKISSDEDWRAKTA